MKSFAAASKVVALVSQLNSPLEKFPFFDRINIGKTYLDYRTLF